MNSSLTSKSRLRSAQPSNDLARFIKRMGILACFTVFTNTMVFVVSYLSVRHQFVSKPIENKQQVQELHTIKPICMENRWQCSNGDCIWMSAVCDGSPNCPEGDDEKLDCSDLVCPDNYFKCSSNGRCIPSKWKCNGNNDCFDHEDEFLPECPCPADFWRCPNGKCLHPSMLCNGRVARDCPHGADEVEENCWNLTCADDNFRCSNGRCIPESWTCNFKNDCSDGSDESLDLCPRPQCEQDEWQCSNGKCIAFHALCNGDNDCTDGADEDQDTCKNISCDEDRFRCSNGRCIPARWKCDTEPDCADGGDEGQETCMNITCGDGHSRCSTTGRCIIQERLCNEDTGCSDQAKDPCLNLTCKADELMCPNGECFPSFYLCDGDNDCPSGFDEKNCPDIDSKIQALLDMYE